MEDSEKPSDSMLSEDAIAETGKVADDSKTLDQGTPGQNTITAVEEPAAESQDRESAENVIEEKRDDVMETVDDEQPSAGIVGSSLDVDMAVVTGPGNANDDINIDELLDLPATHIEGVKNDEIPAETVSISDQFMSKNDSMVIQSEPPQQLMEEADDGQSCEVTLHIEKADNALGTIPNAEEETANDLLDSLLEDKPADDASTLVEKGANEEQREPNTAELGALGDGIDFHLPSSQGQETTDHLEHQLMHDSSELPADIHDPEVLPAAVLQDNEESLADSAEDKELPTDSVQDIEELRADGIQEEETDVIQGTGELPAESRETEEMATEGKDELPPETLLGTEDVPADGNIDSDAFPSEQDMDTSPQDIPADSKEEDTTEAKDLPVGESGAETEATENFAILAGGDHVEGAFGDLEGKILVGPDGSLHLLSGQESLQGMQLMEGDDQPEDDAEAALQGEAAQRELQDQLQAALLQEQAAIFKQEEMKQEAEEEAKEKEACEPPESQSSAESDALATLASAALDHQAPPNGVKSEAVPAVVKKEREEPQWMDVGICKGTHCTVRTYYIPSETQSWDKNWNHITTSTLPDHRALAKLELEAGKAYKFRVAAINSCGRSEWSEYSAFRTSMPGVPGAPSAIKISKTVDGAHLTWDPPSNTAGAIEDYTVYMAVRNVTTDSSQVVSSGATQLAFVRIYQGPENQCSVSHDTLTEAHIDTTTKRAILFRIAARNEKGLGPAIQVRWLQDAGAPNAKAGMAARRSGPELKPHADIKRLKSE